MSSVQTSTLADALAQELRRRLGEERFELWFARKARFEVAADKLTVGVPNLFYASWLQKQFEQELLASLELTLGRRLAIAFKVDAGLFQEARAQEPSPLSPRERGRGEGEPAEIVLPLADRAGHGIEIVTLRAGWQSVRFVSELEILFQHFLEGGYRLCRGTTCDRCTIDPAVYLCGYADTIRPTGKIISGQLELERVILGLSATATKPLLFRAQAGEKLRGAKVSFFKGKATNSKAMVRILESECPFALPTPIDVQQPLMRRHRLKAWPDYSTHMDLFERSQ